MNVVMTGRSMAPVLALCALLASATTAAAQDDDLDALMESDRELEAGERHESASDEADEDAFEDPGEVDLNHEAPPEGWQGESAEAPAPTEEVEEVDDGGVANPISVGLLIGYGVSLEDNNPWGMGFGLGGGYNIGDLFVGGRFVYYLGETVTEMRGSFGISGPSTDEFTVNLWELGAEVGYDIHLGSVALRPGLGLGFASVSGGNESEVYAYLAPGLALLYGVSDTMYLGLDARFQAIFSELGVNGVPILATLGMRF